MPLDPASHLALWVYHAYETVGPAYIELGHPQVCPWIRVSSPSLYALHTAVDKFHPDQLLDGAEKPMLVRLSNLLA